MKKYENEQIGIITRVNKVIQKYNPELFNQNNEDILHDIYLYALEHSNLSKYENSILNSIIDKVLENKYEEQIIYNSIFDTDIEDLVIVYNQYPNELLDVIMKAFYIYIFGLQKIPFSIETDIDKFRIKAKHVKIVIKRFGLFESEYSFADIGDEFGLSKNRVRQIVAEILRRLRHPSRSKYLKDYYLYDEPCKEIKLINEI